MHLLAAVRLMMARHPWIYWLAITVVAATVAVGTASALAGVDAARRSWGEQTRVWMTTSSIDPGQPIVATARVVPVAVVPAGATHADPAGAVARQRIGPGEIVTGDDVSATGPTGLIPAGWVAFDVPGSSEHFAAGDALVVYSGDSFVATGLVTETGDSDLMVAVPAAAGPAMAAGLLADAVTLALTPDPYP
jgi:hypothetical protein